MIKFKFVPKDKTENLPQKIGIYCFKDKEKFLYIGKAVNLKERVKNHFNKSSYRDGFFIDKVEKVGYIKTNSEIEALILEANLIKKYQPKFNIAWRDDKNYFYAGITKEDFPKVFITHQIQNSKIKGFYIGPFVDGGSLKQTLEVLRRVFPYRTCNAFPKKPCLWYQLNCCPAPCLLESKIARQLPDFKKEMKKKCQDNVKNLRKILERGENPVLKNLKKEMKSASKNQDFEKAAKIRDQINSFERAIEHAKIFEPTQKSWEITENNLQKILNTDKKISRIEAYDISNIQGKSATGSMVTFTKGAPDKNFYRRFKVKMTEKPNDTAMIKEILSRRLNHPEWPYPDLILIDGGKPQLNVAKLTIGQLNNLTIPILALAKKENRLFIHNKKNPLLLKNLPRGVFNIILQLRDEAHRFAQKYHHKLREVDLLPKS